MKALSLLLIGIGLLAASACNPGNGKTDGQTASQEDSTLVKMEVKVSPKVAAKMDSLLQAYYRLKDALVESDSIAAMKAAGIMLNKANMVPLQEMNDSARKAQAEIEITGLRTVLSQLQQSHSLEKMRANFELISGATYRLIKGVGLKNITVYRTYCPMAFNDKGAFWLSNSSTIRNPYFGHKMINCGLVKETLQF